MWHFEEILNSIQIKRLDSFFKKQNIEVKTEIFKEKRNEYFKLKNIDSSSDNQLLELMSFYHAINIFYTLNMKAKSKNKSMCTNELKKINTYRIKASRKIRISKKENILLDKSSIINDLLAENRSYREISFYFKRYHRVDVSHTYIRNTIKKFPNIFKVKND